MSQTVPYRPAAGEIPTQPGVYRFRAESGRILYVGKAKNLRARLSNYFAPLHTLHERTRAMVTSAAGVEWTVVGTEIEALQLEFTWINEFDPPYNVQFKDDKSYPFLAVTLGEESPRAIITRRQDIRGARYFGPYPKVWAVKETVDLMQKAIPIRTCNDADYKRAMTTGKPCLAGQIGRCAGPCSQKVTIEEHRVQVLRFVDFLSGRDRSVMKEFDGYMREAAAAQQYELAARFRDRLEVLRLVLGKSAVVFADDLDTDVLGIAHDELAAAVHLFVVRGGRIRGARSWTVDKELELEGGELVERALQNVYEGLEPPREILVPELPEDAAELEVWLSGRREDARSVTLKVPQRGEKAAILQNAERNATEQLGRYKLKRSGDFTARSQALTDLQEALGLPEAPLRIECYDVSHLSGTNIVASMVVFEDGAPRKDQYRRFSIPDSTDDTDSIHQVLTRRLAYLVPGKRAAGIPLIEAAETAPDAPLLDEDGTVLEVAARPAKFAYPPQLLLVDGGQPQVAAAATALRESGVTGIQLVGIAKRLEELWLPGDDYPVILPRGSEALFLVQRLRDEAHRFAITHQRTRRGRDISTVLSEIPGLGPTRVKRLLKHFGSVKALKGAEVAEIAGVQGLGPRLAATVYQELHPVADD